MYFNQNCSLQEEICFINSLMSISDNSNEFIRDLILSGYNTEKKIIKLFIQTSITVHALEVKLLKAGFNINDNSITVCENDEIWVFVPSLNGKISVFVNGRLRT